MQQDELTGSLGRVDRGCLLASQPTCSFQVTSRTGDTERPKASSNKCPESRSVGIYQMIIKFRKSPDLEMTQWWKSSHVLVCFSS